MTDWANRIKRLGTVDPKALTANPMNARVHPEFQRAALTEMLNTLGWIAPVTVNETTGRLVDGHARVEGAVAAGVKKIPVIYLELSEDEERSALATLDPIGALAGYDPDALGRLLDGLSAPDSVQSMLDDLSAHWLDQTPAGTTDDPEPHTEADDEAFWPVITCRVPPPLKERWDAALAAQVGELDRDRIAGLLTECGR